MKKLFILLLVIALIGITACSTLTPVPYSFVESGGETATISITGGNPGLALIYFEGNELPAPEADTYWDPISVPAGRTLEITIHAYYSQQNATNAGLLAAVITSAIASSRSVNRDVTFECPPLETGKNYKLVFRKAAGTTGKNLLVLTEIATGDVIYEEEFESI
jgi:hypothetical protein